MAGLLDGGGAALLNSVFSSVFLDATLHRITLTPNDAGGGTTSEVDQAVKAQRARTTEKMRGSPGYLDTDQRILVLSEGVAAITSDHELTFEGVRWSIATVSRDPAGAYYDLHGQKAGSQP